MKPSPCLQPVRVYNKTLGTYHYVPCGHCDACLCAKGARLSERLGESMALYTHKYFVTLTFDDNHLPVARYDSDIDSYVHPFDTDYNGVCYSVDRLLVEKSVFSDPDFSFVVSKYGGVPVLSRRLLILFKKRLRKIFSKYYGNEYLFIYAVGEYGPTHYRPHYHVILCTNAPIESSVLEMCVHKAWSDFDKVRQEYISQYGKIDFQRIVSRGVKNYVAQYLNCSTNLPACLASGDFRQFYQSSPLIVADSLRFQASSVAELFFRCQPTTTTISLIDNSSCESVYSQTLVYRVFPKCAKFSCLSHSDRVSFYSVFEKCQGLDVSVFVDYILNGYLYDNDCFWLCKTLLVDNDLQASVLRLKRHYYMSRRVCKNAFSLGVDLSFYVSRLELFWSRYELFKLKNFYEMQESLLNDKFNPVSLQDLFTLYYDTDDDLRHLHYYLEQFRVVGFISVDYISQHLHFKNLMHKIVLDTTKTKKRNAYFEVHGLKRPSFINRFKINKSCRNFFQI